MYKLLTAAAVAAMMFGASAAYAQDAGMYVTGEGDSMMVMGGASAEGARVIGDDTYAVPADCPEGSYFRSAENQLTACGAGGAVFGLAAPEAGTMMSSGEAFPTGAMMMSPNAEGAAGAVSGADSGGSGSEGGADAADSK